MQQLIDFLQDLFVVKAPSLPEGLKSFLVKVAPYLVIIGLIFTGLALLSILPALGLMTAYGGAAGATLFGPMMVFSLLFGVINAILLIMAVPGLFKKTESGWRYVFYASLVSLVSSVVSVSIAGLIFSVIGFYFLFQVRSYYNGSGPYVPPAPTPPQYPR